ncbi:MAG TPA: thioredoxin domain-containing protein [Bryobacteraceae bacterium]|jgi:hypothetical protein|nr:thioredoxin domain-containing protein [Bryobacteraceae bacterium]
MPTNALIHEKSPYLRQHANNPVNWLPWGEGAFEEARRQDKPIFLSIGYSTCHWCHVMAHESFESERVAEILNREFISIKLDREERPDVDRIYMLYVQAVTGSGGWPLSVWLTPDLKPFYGGTYFPPDSRYGRPGFPDILERLAWAWKQDRSRVDETSGNILEQLQEYTGSNPETGAPTRAPLDSAFAQFRRSFDPKWGGFGNAPKFPRPSALNFLMRYYAMENNAEALEMVVETLRAMASGGMHDHLGGGFHRYSVDERWFVPHFEKMLYDQAQLAVSYLEAYQATNDALFATTARNIFTYLERDMTSPEGGFYSAEDADSADPENPAHSGEGAFYIWKQAEMEGVLGTDEARQFGRAFGVEKEGNVDHDPQGEFTGRNILFAATDDAWRNEFQESKQKLFEVREKRPRPHLDSKILTAWNGLAISAFAKGYAVLGEARYLSAARKAADFLLSMMYDSASGSLLRRFCEGDPAIPAFLDDYAFLAQAMLDLFEVTGSPDYLKTAVSLARAGFSRFIDSDQGGFFSTAAGAGDLLLRLKDDYDGAEPSGNSVAIDVLLRLAHITGDEAFSKQAEAALRWFGPKLQRQPTAAPQGLVALYRWLSTPEQIIVRTEKLTPDTEVFMRDLRSKFLPFTMVLPLEDAVAAQLSSTAPFLSGLTRTGKLTLYHCKNLACDLPQVIEG